jgi:hypothetical protein
MRTLIIVESPAKARTLGNYLISRRDGKYHQASPGGSRPTRHRPGTSAGGSSGGGQGDGIRTEGREYKPLCSFISHQARCRTLLTEHLEGTLLAISSLRAQSRFISARHLEN